MDVKLIEDRVLILVNKPKETTTQSGLFIPAEAQKKENRGIVTAVGDGKNGQPMTVKVGDDVLFGMHSGHMIEIDEVEYLMVRENEIFAIL